MWPTDQTVCMFGIKDDEMLPDILRQMPAHKDLKHWPYRNRADDELEPAVQKRLPTAGTQDEVRGLSLVSVTDWMW